MTTSGECAAGAAPDGRRWRRAAASMLKGFGLAVVAAVIEWWLDPRQSVVENIAVALVITLTFFFVMGYGLATAVSDSGHPLDRWRRARPWTTVLGIGTALAATDFALLRFMARDSLVTAVLMALWFAAITVYYIRPHRETGGDGEVGGDAAR